jgi:anti-sigma-K factor RskA
MNINVPTTMNTRRWNGVVLALIVALAVHMAAGSDATRTDEPWPLLLSDNSADSDPAVTLLQQRASGSLERLVQSAHESEQL